MKHLKPFAALCSTLILPSFLFAQHAESSLHVAAGHALSGHHKHSVSLVISHAHVREGLNSTGQKSFLVLPSWGVDYFYHVNPNWAIGVQADLILESFIVEKHLDGNNASEQIERSRPFAPSIMGMYKPNHHWGFKLGIGQEFAKEENLPLTRLGVEYAYPLAKHRWEITANVGYDFKWKAYDTFVLGLGISKLF